MATRSSTLAWKIPWMEEPCGLYVVHGVAKSWTWLSDFTFTFHFHALEKEMASHSSVLAWRIPGTGEPGGLPPMGSHRVGHDWSDSAAAAAGWKHWVLFWVVLKSSGYCSSLCLSTKKNSARGEGIDEKWLRIGCLWGLQAGGREMLYLENLLGYSFIIKGKSGVWRGRGLGLSWVDIMLPSLAPPLG